MSDFQDPLNPSNSPNEKLQVQRRFKNEARFRNYLQAQGIDPDLADRIGAAMDRWEEDKQYLHRSEIGEFERWANQHTHPGGTSGTGFVSFEPSSAVIVGYADGGSTGSDRIMCFDGNGNNRWGTGVTLDDYILPLNPYVSTEPTPKMYTALYDVVAAQTDLVVFDDVANSSSFTVIASAIPNISQSQHRSLEYYDEDTQRLHVFRNDGNTAGPVYWHSFNINTGVKEDHGTIPGSHAIDIRRIPGTSQAYLSIYSQHSSSFSTLALIDLATGTYNSLSSHAGTSSASPNYNGIAFWERTSQIIMGTSGAFRGLYSFDTEDGSQTEVTQEVDLGSGGSSHSHYLAQGDADYSWFVNAYTSTVTRRLSSDLSIEWTLSVNNTYYMRMYPKGDALFLAQHEGIRRVDPDTGASVWYQSLGAGNCLSLGLGQVA